MSEKVLCVDDDPRILRGYRRHVGEHFDFEIAEGGAQGLEVLDTKGSFAVVVSDMRMPGMDGIEFLAKVRQRSRDTVRMMLTGNADLQTAINAVNEGNIFRFLTKPCPLETFMEMLHAGIRQYRLIMAERELLQDTLMGSMKTMTDIVAMLNPTAFGRAARVAQYIKHTAALLELPNAWEFELAGMLSQIGCVALPPGTLDKLYTKDKLTPDDRKLLAAHPKAARKLLENIPRLNAIAQIVGRQQEPFWNQKTVENLLDLDRTSLGVQLLKVAMDLDELLASGVPFDAAWRKMSGLSGRYNPEILDALMSLRPKETPEETREVCVRELEIGMIADADIRAKDGSLLVPKGGGITYPVLLLVRSMAETAGVAEPLLVKTNGWLIGDACPTKHRVKSGNGDA